MRGLSRQRKLRGLGLLLVVFLAGALLGRSLAPDRSPGLQLPPTDSVSVSLDGDPFESIGLTDSQRATVDSILDALGAETDSLLSQSRGVLVGRAADAKDGIRAVLTPDQAVVFDSVLNEIGGLRVRFARRMVAPDSVGSD